MVSFPKIKSRFTWVVITLLFFLAVGIGIWAGVFNKRDTQRGTGEEQNKPKGPSLDNTKLKNDDIKTAGVTGSLPPYFPATFKDMADSKVVKNYTGQAADTGLVQSVRIVQNSASIQENIIYYGEYFEHSGWVIQPVVDTEALKILSAQKGTVSAKVSATKDPQNNQLSTVEVVIIVDKTYENTQK